MAFAGAQDHGIQGGPQDDPNASGLAGIMGGITGKGGATAGPSLTAYQGVTDKAGADASHFGGMGDSYRQNAPQISNQFQGDSRAGIAGTLSGGREQGWPEDAWRIDPALFDGGLQLAVLWGVHVLGGASLPMAVNEVKVHRRGLADGAIRGIVNARQVHDARTVCDIAFVDASGAVIAEMLGVETVKRPDEASASSSSNAAAMAKV